MSPDDTTGPAEADLDFLLGRRERADAMADRLRRTAGWRGLDRSSATAVSDCFLAAMRTRAAVIRDDHDPAYLHPARTALILLDDAGVTDPVVLMAAVLQDAMRPELAASTADVRRLAGDEVASVLDVMPSPGTDPSDIMETLVALPDDVLALYLAAWLDRARHAHLGAADEWPAIHGQVTRALVPLAHRCNPLLAKRFERWAGAFARRFLGRRG